MYKVILEQGADSDLRKLAKSEPIAFKKAMKLLDELYVHPKTGTGHPEQLRGTGGNRWSRRISDRHRLVYEIRDTEVIVIVIAAYGHYDDK